MSSTTLQKDYSPGSVMIRYLKGKFEALRYLPKLAGGFLKFNSAGELIADSDLRPSGVYVDSVDTRTGAGAISVTKGTTKLVTTGANALTLADGQDGQIKRIHMITDGGDGTLTPATKTGYTTITFNDAGDDVVLQFISGRGWEVVSNNGCTVA
jgi:hypothetical protein